MTTQDVDTYLSKLPDDQRTALEGLRQTIRSIIPDATEELSYGVPAFKLNKRGVVSLGAAKNHCAFYVQSPAVMDAHEADLQGYDTAKGTVRFAADSPLPEPLVRKLVLARVAENEAAAKRR